MESKAFLELEYRAINYYLAHLPINKEIPLNWERNIPQGKTQKEHYQKAGDMLFDIIKSNVEAADTSILIIPPFFLPVINLLDDYAPSDACKMNGTYQCGIFKGIAVAVDPTIPAGKASYMILFDLAGGKVVRIMPGIYDYIADLAE